MILIWTELRKAGSVFAGKRRKTDSRGQEYYGFPEPAAAAALSEKDMMECRMGYRCKYVFAAEKAVAGGEIKLERLLAADERTTIKSGESDESSESEAG